MTSEIWHYITFVNHKMTLHTFFVDQIHVDVTSLHVSLKVRYGKGHSLLMVMGMANCTGVKGADLKEKYTFLQLVHLLLVWTH